MNNALITWIATVCWSLAALIFAVDAHNIPGVVACSVGVVVNVVGLSAAWESARAAKRAEDGVR